MRKAKKTKKTMVENTDNITPSVVEETKNLRLKNGAKGLAINGNHIDFTPLSTEDIKNLLAQFPEIELHLEEF